MRMLATGQNCLPAGGIGAIAEQLASRIPADTIYTGDRGVRVQGRGAGVCVRVCESILCAVVHCTVAILSPVLPVNTMSIGAVGGGWG
jgi:hypothetical protein